jgi:hypothetical protein
LDMVFTCDDAHRLNPHKEKLFSLLAFFLANYKVGATVIQLCIYYKTLLGHIVFFFSVFYLFPLQISTAD